MKTRVLMKPNRDKRDSRRRRHGKFAPPASKAAGDHNEPTLEPAMLPSGGNEPHAPHLFAHTPPSVVSAIQSTYSQPWSSVQP